MSDKATGLKAPAVEAVMFLSEEDYFYKRAEAELRMAQAAGNPCAVHAHYTLAAHYLDRAYGGHETQPASPDQIRARLPISTIQQ